MAEKLIKFRAKKGYAIGCDPGKDGAIALTKDGHFVDAWQFSQHIIHTGFNDNLLLVDPEWLSKIIKSLRVYTNTITIESPTITTYGGKITTESISKLQQLYSQVAYEATRLKMQIVHANPQNWQGYHGFAKTQARSVKEVIAAHFKDQGFVYPSGVADAICIANYVYQVPEAKPEAKVKRSGKDKILF